MAMNDDVDGTTKNDNCDGNGTTERSRSVSSVAMACRNEERFFFFKFMFFQKNSSSLLQQILQLVPLIIHVESRQRWK